MNEGGAINNYIRSKSTSREEAEKAIENLQDRMLNFNPEALRADGKKVGVEGFGESIFANTRFAKLFAKSELFKEGEKKKQEKRQDDSTLQLVDKSSGSKPKPKDDKLSKPPSETIKYKSEALKNLGITKKEGETDKDAIENKISEVITKAYEGKDITRFKQTANIPEAVAKLYADMFGITTESGIKALRVKAQNFPEGDASGVTRARQFLIDNAAADFARIPRTKDDFVKAGRAGGTGVYQTKLGKALYNKNGKLTGSLRNYIDIISGKNVTVNGIEFNALVKGKKLPIYRDAQHIKAGVDFHIRNRILETLEPTQGKRIQMGAKFSEPKIPRPKGPISLEEAKEISKAAYEVKIDKKEAKRTTSKGVEVSTKVTDWSAENMQEFNSVVKNFIDKNPRWAAYFREGFTGTLQTHTYGRVDIFNDLVPGYKDSKKEITRLRFAAGKLQLASKINKALPTLKEDNKARVDLFKEIALDMEKFLAIEGNENKFYVFEQLFKDGSRDQNHFLRSLIPLKFATVDPFTLKLNIKEEVTEEHTSPVVGIGRLIMEAIKTGNVKQVFKEIIEPSIAQGGLLRSVDENMSKELKQDQAKEFYDTVLKLNKEGKLNSVKDALWYIRYSIENDANPFALLLLEKGVTVGEYFLGKTNLSKGSLVETQEIANDFINKILTGKITQKEADQIGLNATALVNFSKAMAFYKASGAAADSLQLLGNMATGISNFFGGKTSIDYAEIKTFAESGIGELEPKITANAKRPPTM